MVNRTWKRFSLRDKFDATVRIQSFPEQQIGTGSRHRKSARISLSNPLSLAVWNTHKAPFLSPRRNGRRHHLPNTIRSSPFPRFAQEVARNPFSPTVDAKHVRCRPLQLHPTASQARCLPCSKLEAWQQNQADTRHRRKRLYKVCLAGAPLRSVTGGSNGRPTAQNLPS